MRVQAGTAVSIKLTTVVDEMHEMKVDNKEARKEVVELRKDMDAKFEAARKDMDAKFEAARKDMDAKFDAARLENAAHFQLLNKRFDDLIVLPYRLLLNGASVQQESTSIVSPAPSTTTAAPQAVPHVASAET